jgi:dipeptidyl aminopeptidase/acylaminoacyl peptidase
MRDNLIDAVDWAIAQGIADPKRGGYGGYSALAAAASTPGVCCIVICIT